MENLISQISLAQIIPIIMIGLFAGVAAGFFGIGGGTIIVPAMIYFGYDIKQAIAMSVMQMMLSSLYGSYINYKKGNLALNDGITVGVGGFVGASFSGLMLSLIASEVLEILFLLIVIFMLYRFARGKQSGDSKIANLSKITKITIMLSIGFFVGIFAISLGIGGGLLLSPLLGYFLGLDSKKIVPISLFFVLFASVSGFISIASHGHMESLYIYGLIIGLASMNGVRFGIKLVEISSQKIHKTALIIMYIFIIITFAKEIFLNS